MNRKQVQQYIFVPILTSIIGCGCTVGLVYLTKMYGILLFLGVPFFMGFFSALLLHYIHSYNYLKNISVALIAGLLSAMFLLLLGHEGLICLVMYLPVGLPLLMIGSCYGTFLCRDASLQKNITTSLFLIPILIIAEVSLKTQQQTRKVVTSVMINGQIQDVWNKVVEFPEIQSEPEGILRFGIAYPIRARIDGIGENAIRYCEFNTGSFVEPITRWEEPTLLAFDVSENPSPMTELTFYTHVDPPHLHGYMVSEKGQFQLQELENGSVLLTGTTWYHHDLQPYFYWGFISDAIINQIHNRVLNHIKKEVEKDIRQVARTQ